MNLVKVVGADFEGALETDGRVRRSTQNLALLTGWTDERAAAYIERQGWQATLVEPGRIEDAPAVSGVLAAFPGARIVDIRGKFGSG